MRASESGDPGARSNVLVIGALAEATGNAIIARRIAKHLEAQHNVVLVDSNETSVPALKKIVEENKLTVAVALHALLAGPFVRATGLPYALVFGGTDLYEPTHDLQQTQMSRAVVSAARLLAFSPENLSRAEWMWPDAAGRVRLLAQSVELPELPTGKSLRQRLGLTPTDVMVLLPTGIRRVKDPLHVVEAVSVWHTLHPRVHLVIVGAVIEPDYADDALRQLQERPGIHYVGALARPELLAAMRDADVVLNTSLSEGMCCTILETMALGTPVIARRNAGNESLVLHGHTGLLYDTPGELVGWISALMQSAPLRERLAKTALKAIEQHHTPAVEQRAYLDLVGEVTTEIARDGRATIPPARPIGDDLALVVPNAERIGIDPAICKALAAQIELVPKDPPLQRLRHALSGLLGTAPPGVGLAEAHRAALERDRGPAFARTFNLLLALTEVPAMEARHAARGIDRAITRETLQDLRVWSSELMEQGAGHGISFDTLSWAQRYLRGELLQFGLLQFELRPFAAPMRVYRNLASGQLSAVSLDGRTIDLVSGVIRDTQAAAHPAEAWKLALEPGTPILEMFIPGNNSIGLTEIAKSLRAAYATFGVLAPETLPAAVAGESWRLDPQVLTALPPELGIHALQKICALYPSALSEAKTLRRLFGPDFSRPKLAGVHRPALDPLRRGVAELLANPDVTLRARCGFVLRDDIAKIPEWSQ